MRFGARLASAKLALLSRRSATSRTMDGEYVFWAQFPFHHTFPCKRRSNSEPVSRLCPANNGHRPILQKSVDKCAVYLQAAVVGDEALLLERIHRFAHPCAGGTNHLREGRLAHLEGVFWL